MDTCEDRYEGSELTECCTRRAVFRVQVGTRNTDAQLSCGIHLVRTCRVMAYGDGDLDDPPKNLTVTMLGIN